MPSAIGEDRQREQLARTLRARRARSSHGTSRAPADDHDDARRSPPCRARSRRPRARRRVPAVAPSAPSRPRSGAIDGSSTRTTTVNRSSTISQPTAIRPCGVSSSSRSVERAQQDDRARDRDREAEHEARRRRPSRAHAEPDPEDRRDGDLARPRPGSRSRAPPADPGSRNGCRRRTSAGSRRSRRARSRSSVSATIPGVNGPITTPATM